MIFFVTVNLNGRFVSLFYNIKKNKKNRNINRNINFIGWY